MTAEDGRNYDALLTLCRSINGNEQGTGEQP